MEQIRIIISTALPLPSTPRHLVDTNTTIKLRGTRWLYGIKFRKSGVDLFSSPPAMKRRRKGGKEVQKEARR